MERWGDGRLDLARKADLVGLVDHADLHQPQIDGGPGGRQEYLAARARALAGRGR